MNPRVQLVLDELARHRHQFEALCLRLTTDELATPVPATPWSVLDYIAHLATIDGLIAAGFQPLAGLSHVPPTEIPAAQPFDIDDWNGAAVAARRGRSVAALLEEAAGHRAQFNRVVSALDDAQLDMAVPFGSRRASGLPDVPVPLRAVLWAIAVHDPSHTRDILRALPRRAAEPFVIEWLASTDAAAIEPAIAARRA